MLTGGIKDVGHMQRLGKESGAPMPVVDVILQHLQQVQVLCSAVALLHKQATGSIGAAAISH